MAITNLEKIQDVVDYIESRLREDISLNDVADRASFSIFYFSKIFSCTVGETIMEYVRKRRLTEAARDLVATDRPVMEIALDYGYDSQEAFTRAFKRMYGTTPARCRRGRKHYKLIERKRLTLEGLRHLNGGMTMEPRIVEKKEFKVVGLRYQGTNKNGEIGRMWDRFLPRIKEIKHRVNAGASYGVCEALSEPTEDMPFYYISGVEVDSFDDIPEGMVSETVPSARYVVFTHKGPVSKLEETYDYIYGTWFPKSEYEPAKTPDMEIYDERFTNGEDSELDIYIPLK